MLWQNTAGQIIQENGVIVDCAECPCEEGGPCSVCSDLISGVTITIEGIIPSIANPPEPDCYCDAVNGTYFIPWNEPGAWSNCSSSKVFPYSHDICEDSNKVLWVQYTIQCTNGILQLFGGISVYSSNFISRYLFIRGSCIPGVACIPPAECAGVTCTDTSLIYDIGQCETTSGKMTMTIQ